MGYVSDLRKYVGHNPILTAGSVLLVFNDKNQVLMQHRTDFNAWGLPGGAMELGETFEEAAKRELKEETNLEIDECIFLKVFSGKGTYREYPNGDKLYDVTAIYVVSKYHGELAINDNESTKLEWFDLNNLPCKMSPNTQNYLDNFGNFIQEGLEKKLSTIDKS